MTFEDTIRSIVREAVREELRAALAEQRPAEPASVVSMRLKVAAVAKLASCDPETVRRAIRAKKLRAFKPDGSREWLVEQKDVRLWIETGGASSAPEVDISEELHKSLRRARGTGR